MSVSYIGNCNFAEAPGVILTIDAFGVDYLRRTFVGRTDKEREFLLRYPRNVADYDHPSLNFTGANVLRDGAFSTVELTFAGLKNNEVPLPNFSYGLAVAENQLTAIDGRVTSIEYRAPSMTVNYVSREVPRKLKWKGRMVKTEESFQIVGTRGAVADDFLDCTGMSYQQTASAVAAAATAAGEFTGFLYDVELITTAWQVQQAGLIWTVSETVEGRIVQHQIGSIPRNFASGKFGGGNVIVR